MREIKINKRGKIKKGKLKGYEGLVVAYDNKEGLVVIELDRLTLVEVGSDNVYQY